MVRLNLTSVLIKLFALILIGLTFSTAQVRANEMTNQVFLPLMQNGGDDNNQLPNSPPSQTGAGKVKQLAWFYKPPTDSNLGTIKENFSSFILTKNDEDERDALRAEGVEAPFLQYVALDVIIDPGSCTAQPWKNQAADRPGDFCDISDNHADWFLLDQAGNRMVHDLGGGMKGVVMDPGNPGWRAFWLERAREGQETLGWDGVFLDNVEASLAKRERRGQLPAAYPDDASYQAAVEGFLAYIYTSYFQPEARPLQGNIIALRDYEVWFRYLQYMDGAMEEGWAVDWSDGYLNADDWEEHMNRASRTQAEGKQAVLVSQGAQDNTPRQEFSYASYLLVSNGSASFRYTNADDYGEPWLYSNYDYDLGAPLAARYQDGNTWRRDFEHGSVSVDPTTNSASILTNSMNATATP